MITTVEQYEEVVNGMFDDKVFDFSHGFVLWIFTRTLIDMHPQISYGIGRVYTEFINNNFNPFLKETLNLN